MSSVLSLTQINMQILENHWQLLLGIAGFIVSYTTLKLQNEDQEKRICHLESLAQLNEGTMTEIKVALAEIQLDLKWIKQSLKQDK